MKRTIALVAGVGMFLAGQPVRTQLSSHQSLTVHSRVYANTREIRVLTPPGYDAPVNSARRYPVFYFTDGVAAWDAWGVPRTFADLWERRAIPPFVVVGIANGGSTKESTDPILDRASEYLPYPDGSWAGQPPVPRGREFPTFLLEEVAPAVGATFRTMRTGKCTGLAGASYGAAVVLHTAVTHPEGFDFLLLESPSLHVGGRQLLRDARAARLGGMRLALGVGTAEGETPAAQLEMVKNARSLRDILQEMRPAPRVLFNEERGATHWFDSWARRLPRALRFLLAGAEPGECGGWQGLPLDP